MNPKVLFIDLLINIVVKFRKMTMLPMVILFLSSVCSLHAQELETLPIVKSIDRAEIDQRLWDSYTCEEGFSLLYVRLNYCASLRSSDPRYTGHYYKMILLNGDEFLWKNRDYLSTINLRLDRLVAMIPERYYKIGFSWKRKPTEKKKPCFFQVRNSSIELTEIYDFTLHFYEEVQKSEIPDVDFEALNKYLETNE